MAEREKITTPTSSAGLIRFYDVTSSNILLGPKAIIGFAVVFLAIVLLLQFLI